MNGNRIAYLRSMSVEKLLYRNSPWKIKNCHSTFLQLSRFEVKDNRVCFSHCRRLWIEVELKCFLTVCRKCKLYTCIFFHFQFGRKYNIKSAVNRFRIGICDIENKFITFSCGFEVNSVAEVFFEPDSVDQKQLKCISVQGGSHHHSAFKNGYLTSVHYCFPKRFFCYLVSFRDKKDH